MVLNELAKKYPKLRKLLVGTFVHDTNPDIYTYASFILALVAGYLFSKNFFALGAAVTLVSAFFDVLDGDIARAYGRASKIGDFLDHTFDRLSDLAILVGIGLSTAVDLRIALLAYVSVVLVSYLGTQAHALTNERLYAGLLGRADRLTLLIIAAFIAEWHVPALKYGVWAILILSVITFLQRFGTVYAMLSKLKGKKE